MALLEICCYSTEYALTMQQNDADRVELCAAPKEEGLTPSLGVLKSVRQRMTVPVYPIIRPRGGDFYYDDGEFAAILEDVRIVRELGFPGLAAGVLEVDGNADVPRMERITAAAGPLTMTFHRAFDMCTNPSNMLDNLTELGITRVLTSGQRSDTLQGLSKITEPITHRDAPIVMAEVGVRVESSHRFLDAEVLGIHSSTEAWQASPVRYHSQGLSMPSDAHANEYLRYVVDGAVVAEMEGIVERHQAKWFLPLHHVTQYDAYSYQAPAVSTGALFYP